MPATETRTTIDTFYIWDRVRNIFYSHGDPSEPYVIGVVAITRLTIWCVHVTRSWTKSLAYIFARKKCRRSNAVSLEEKDIVAPYPVTRGRGASGKTSRASER